MIEPPCAAPSLLVERIAALDEPGALDLVRARAAAGEDPLAIIDDCHRGMRFVGEHYESGKYFISGLIMAGEIFRETMDILAPGLMSTPAATDDTTVLLCTVQGDIHDIGKSIVALLLRSHGIGVHDLGVDVAPADVARAAIDLTPDVIGLSGLLSVATRNMKATIDALRAVAPELEHPPVVIIGGGQVNERVREWTGADLWASDAARGVALIRETLATARATSA